MRTFVVKWLPRSVKPGDLQPKHTVIHFIDMPEPTDCGFYRHTSAWNAWAYGEKKAGVTKDDRLHLRINGPWAPNGLYYTHDFNFDGWQYKCDLVREFQIENGRDEATINRLDERNLPRVIHTDIHAFFAHIGWNHPKRRYTY